MTAINGFHLTGRATFDPELKEIGEMKITSICLAVNRQPKKDTKTDFFYIKFFNKGAELVFDHVGKGRQVAVEGTFKMNSWKDEDGKKNSKIELIGNDFRLLDSKPKTDEEKELNKISDDIPF